MFFRRKRYAIPHRSFYSGRRCGLLLRGGFRYPARYARRSPPGEGTVVVERYYLYRAGAGSGDGASDHAQIPVAEPVLHDDGNGCGCLPAVGVCPARIAPSNAYGDDGKEPHDRITGKPLFLKPSGHYHPQRVGDPDLREYVSGATDGSDGLRPW